MKINKQKIGVILLVIISIISMEITSLSHSGRTDANGGHKDNKNVSGLGSYHYHCGGNPPHLHTNGVCPYSSSSKASSTSSSNAKTSSSSTKSSSTTTTKPATIVATGIQINEQMETLEMGKSKTLTATITPNHVTDKTVIWKSSDETIATVSAKGEVVAKKAGTVQITATTANGKTNTITINIKEKPKEIKTKSTNSINTGTTSSVSSNDVSKSNSESLNSNPIGEIFVLALLGGGGYWGYKKLGKKAIKSKGKHSKINHKSKEKRG